MPPATIEDFEKIFSSLVRNLIGLGAIIFFLLFLSGGFKYLTSGGDPKAVESGKKTFTSALTGLLLMAGSYIILVIIEKFTGVASGTLTIFDIVR